MIWYQRCEVLLRYTKIAIDYASSQSCNKWRFLNFCTKGQNMFWNQRFFLKLQSELTKPNTSQAVSFNLNCSQTSLQRRRFLRARKCFCSRKRHVETFRGEEEMEWVYFYSTQSSTVIKSKMVATTTRTRTRFHPPKIRLHCRLPSKRFALRPRL